VVVANFNVNRVALYELKTDPPLIIDPDTPLAGSVTAQPLQLIPWRDLQLTYIHDPVKHCELSHSNGFNVAKARDPSSVIHRLRVLAPK
jgi:hypothetical protein